MPLLKRIFPRNRSSHHVFIIAVIDNPQQDIPLTAILYDLYFNFIVEDLAHIRLINPQLNMYETLLFMTSINELQEQLLPVDKKVFAKLQIKVNDFLMKSHYWRDYAPSHSVPELIWLLLNDRTDYAHDVGGLPKALYAKQI